MFVIDKFLKLAGKENFQLDPAIEERYILRQCWKYGWMIVRGKIFALGHASPAV